MGVGQKPLTLLALFRGHNKDFSKRIGLDRIKETLDSYLRSYIFPLSSRIRKVWMMSRCAASTRIFTMTLNCSFAKTAT